MLLLWCFFLILLGILYKIFLLYIGIGIKILFYKNNWSDENVYRVKLLFKDIC